MPGPGSRSARRRTTRRTSWSPRLPFEEPHDDREVVANPLERRELDTRVALVVEQDQRVLERLERVLEAKSTVVGDERGGGLAAADASAEPDRRSDPSSPSVDHEVHGTRVAVRRRRALDPAGSIEGRNAADGAALQRRHR